MTENQKLWLAELIEEYRGSARNNRLWATGSGNAEFVQMYEANAEECDEFADMLATLLEG